MTKQEYIQCKKTNQMKILYEYYKEKFNPKKHNPFLTEEEFFPYIQISRLNLHETLIKVVNHYDSYYNVVTILDEQGNIITSF
jgi:hypothetical protein